MKIIGNISVQLKKEIRVLILAGIMISFTSAASAQDYLVLHNGTVRKVQLLNSASPCDIVFFENNELTSIPLARISLVIRENRTPHRTASITVKLMNGQKIRGGLAYADSAGFMIWKGGGKYHPGDSLRISYLLPWASIRYLGVKENGKIFKGALSRLGAGMLVAHNVMGSAKDAPRLPGDLPRHEPSPTGSSYTIDFKTTINGNLEQYLSIIGLLRRYAMLSSPPQEWPLRRHRDNPGSLLNH